MVSLLDSGITFIRKKKVMRNAVLCSLLLHREMFHDGVCAGGEVLAGLGDGVGVGDWGVGGCIGCMRLHCVVLGGGIII